MSPDTEDPEAAGDQAGEVAAQREANGVSVVNTEWKILYPGFRIRIQSGQWIRIRIRKQDWIEEGKMTHKSKKK